MDTKQTLTIQPSVVTATGVECDQAVFTSVRTPMGQGYQLIASSAGLTSAEKQDITRRSPTHGGLCDSSPDAMALAYYSLSSGRMALAFSCDAGAEHTGRGARRIYTHITVVSPDVLTYFNYNPFDLLRSLESSGTYEVNLKPPKVLPALHVEPVRWSIAEESEESAKGIGPGWFSYIVSHMIERDTLLIATENEPFALAESVLQGIPGPIRTGISMSVGLRYSVGRKYEVSFINGDIRQTQRLAKGQKLEFLQPNTDTAAHQVTPTPWTSMIELCVQGNHWDDLSSLTSRDYPDCDQKSLDAVGSCAYDLFSTRTAQLPQLFELANQRVGSEGSNVVESDVLLKLVLLLQTRICEALRSESNAHVWWEPITRMLSSSQRHSDFAHPAASILIAKKTETSALDGLMMIKDAWRLSHSNDARFRLHETLNQAFERLAGQIADMSTKALEDTRDLLNTWPSDLAPDSEIGDIQAIIDTRLFETAGEPTL